MVSFNAEWLVDSLDTISTSISKQWVALIMLPAVSCIAGQCHMRLPSTRVFTLIVVIECATAVNVSVKDQLSLSVSVAVSSTIVSYSICI